MYDRSGSTAGGGLLGGVARLLGYRSKPSEELVAYAREVQPVARRAQRLYRVWLDRAQDIPKPEELANAASVLRWEFASAADRLASIVPPPPAARLHAQLLACQTDATRAAQLMGAGYRSTTYATVCDGQSLFSRTDERLGLLLEQLSRWAPDLGQADASRLRPAPLAKSVRRAS
jgi:hypothetical protein